MVEVRLTSFCYFCEAVPRPLFWALNGLYKLPKVRFESLFNLIGKSTITFLTGQSWRVVSNPGTHVGTQNKDFGNVSQTNVTRVYFCLWRSYPKEREEYMLQL